MAAERFAVDPEVRRALSDFYREEFLRHFEQLPTQRDKGRPRAACLQDKVITDLDSVCWRPDFPAVAETPLQNFDALTRLSELDPRQRH